MSSSVYYLTLQDFEDICFSIVKMHYQFNEPIPDFKTRYPDKLETILEIPKQNVFGKELYPTIYEKASCYFYFIIKNHPFLNGNKRLAIVSTDVFLSLNQFELEVPWQEIYQFSINLAKTSPLDKNMFKDTVLFIKKYSELIK